MKSVLYQKILKKYNLKNGSLVGQEEFLKIHKDTKIELKDFCLLFNISSSGNSKIKNNNGKVRIKLYQKDSNKESIYERYLQNNLFKQIIENKKLNKDELESIINNGYNYSIIKILFGIKTSTLNKISNGQIKSTYACDSFKKFKVDCLLIDLKYLSKYGYRYYSIKELLEIVNQYDLTIDEFLEYIDKKASVCQMYKESLKINKKIYYGKKVKLSKRFKNQNTNEIMEKINKKAKMFSNIYGCYGLKNDFSQIAYLYILEEGGLLEKNSIVEKSEYIKRMVNLSKYKMLEYYYKNPRSISIDSEDKNDACRIENILSDNKYNPETIIEHNDYGNLGNIISEYMDIEEVLRANSPDELAYIMEEQLLINNIRAQNYINNIRNEAIYKEIVKFDNSGKVMLA